MQEVLTLRGRTALFVALASLALPIRALDFGEVEVLSGIGEKLDARIPLKAGAGEWFHVTCLALSRTSGALPPLADGVVSVERRSRSTNLRVRTATPVSEPAIAFGVTSTCAGAQQPATREFSVLLDLPRVARAPGERQAMPAARRPPPAPAVAMEPRHPAPLAKAPPPPPVPESRSTGTQARPTPAPAPAPATATAPAARQRAGSEFVLRLSSEPIDVSRTRTFDEKSRAVLRERLRLLDNDDQVAAMLALRDNMQRLEARVTELQLKLAAAPPVIARAEPRAPQAPAATAPPAVSAQPATSAPASPLPKVEAAPTTNVAPSVATPPAKPAQPIVAPPPKPAPPVAAAPAKVEPPAIRAPAPPTPAADDAVLPGGIRAWLAAIAALLALLAAWLWRRRRTADEAEPVDTADDAATAPGEPAGNLDAEQPIEVAAPVRAQIAPPVRAEIASDASLATRLEENTEALRRRYIEERFPEIRNRTIVLDDPASVVKGGRLFYEDGAIPRAVELLRFAIEDRPDALRPWLALFEIYRLERLTGEYAELAGRFRERHGATDAWEKVRAFGREIDPANPLYQDAPGRSLETIGPRESRRLAAANADPIVENWLEAPMDFENEVLATELRRSLMARAAVEERDLVANPMPALRSVEMFSVG